MGKLFLIILAAMIFAGRDCLMKQNGTNISDDIKDEEKCSKGISSFLDSSTGFFQSAMDSMLSSSKTVEPKFLSFSRKNVGEPCYVTNANFTDWDSNTCTFDPKLKTIFIIHGFKDSYAPWTREMKDALILREECNVFIVECGQPAETYSDVFKNIPEVGKQVALFIHNLVESKGLDLQRVHIIGHSAGAQSAGFAGKEIKRAEKRPVYRITGLDPAGPGFYDTKTHQRLDATDADFVDIIHTNGGCSRLEGLGHPDALGHFDFYPNGGKMQPGCLTVSEFIGKIDADLAKSTFRYLFGKLEQPEMQNMTYLLCSHVLSYGLFTASILNDRCKFRSVQCPSWRGYLSGQCDDNEKVVMGYYADRYRDVAINGPKKFYLKTKADPPYC